MTVALFTAGLVATLIATGAVAAAADPCQFTQGGPTLSFTITPDRTEVARGGAVTYTVSLTNNQGSSKNIGCFDVELPAGFTYIADSTVLIQPTTAPFPANPSESVSNNRTTLTWGGLNMSLGAGGQISFSFQAHVPASAELGTNRTVNLHGEYTGVGSTWVQTVSNTGAVEVVAAPPTDLAITKEAPESVAPGGTITWTLSVANHGPGDTTGFTVTDAVPQAVTDVHVVSPTDDCVLNGNTVTCSGSRTPFEIVLQGTAPTRDGACVGNSARVVANEEDPDEDNDVTPAVETCVGAVADLSIGKRVTPTPAVPGETVRFGLRVRNHGPDTARRVVVTDRLAPALSFVSATRGCRFTDPTVTCRRRSLAADASARFTIVARLASSSTAGVVNTARADSVTLDPDGSNNESTVSVPAGPRADLSMTKTASSRSVTSGGQVTYALQVTNHGPSDAWHVTVVDPLHPGLTLRSAIPSQGRCHGGEEVLCRLGRLPAGGSALVLVTVEVSRNFSGQVRNVARVVAGTEDPHPSNDADGDTIIAVAPPTGQPVSRLAIVKRVDRHRVRPGQRLTFRVRVTNHGPDAASDVRVTDAATRALRVVSVHSSQGRCRRARPVHCSLGRLRAGASATIRIIATLPHRGTFRNAAGVVAADRDPRPSDNLASVRVAVVRRHRPPPPVTG